MKKNSIMLCVIMLQFAISKASDAAVYTLTVKSYNPSSGIGIIVSPADVRGKGNGTTEFTRAYTGSTVVSLTAPQALKGKKFQKWAKSGVDYSTTPATTVKITRNTTMTAYYINDTTAPVTGASPSGGTYPDKVAVTLTPNEPAVTYYCTGGASCTPTTVYSGPLTLSSSTVIRYYSRDAAGNAETVKTQTYTIQADPHASLTWTGPKVCLGCHADEAMEMETSAHYQWQGQAVSMVNGEPIQGKLNTAVNSYCGNIIGNWGGCSSCHVGLGKRPDDAGLSQQQHLENIDCLICHQKDYKRKKDPLTGLMIPDTANMTITMDEAVKTVHKPTRSTCLTCHAKGGGGDNNKRGDMSVAHGSTADRSFDVHMASTSTGNLVCQKCHTVQQHRIAGRGSDLRETDLNVRMSCSTSECHPGKVTPTGHSTAGISGHLSRVACQTCHIPKYARDAADTVANESTEMTRDWSRPEWSTILNRWEPTLTRANNVLPEYAFWNGTSWGYSLKDQATYFPGEGRYMTSVPVGDINGTGSKLYPFKYKTAQVPYATNLNILIPIETKTYFGTAGSVDSGVDNSIKSSLRLMGYSDTEPYTWVSNGTFQLITHEVPPAAGNALSCTQCHVSGTARQMNLKELGYATKKPVSSLCGDCHEPESYSGGFSGFKWVHDQHVGEEKLACSRCHNFSRPERTDLR